MQTAAAQNKPAKKWSILAVLVAIPFMVALDGTIVNVALPVMVKDLSASMESVQTVVSSYLIAVVASILLFGRLGDVLGKGRVFMFGIAVFAAGSLVAGFSQNLALLNVARVVEGIGGAAAMANNQGIITEVFPEKERGRALGISGVFSAVGTMLGPPIGGLLVTYLNWNSIFLINVPVGLIAFVAAAVLLPKGKRTRQRVDYTGALVLAVSIVVFFMALFNGERHGYLRAPVLLGMGGGLALLGLFFFMEARKSQPILDLALFKNAAFTLGILCVLIQFTANGGVSILQPFYLEDVRQMGAATTGVVMMSMPIALGIASPISGALADKYGAAPLTFLGLVLMLCGILLLGTLGAATPLWLLVVYLCLVGIGGGLFAAPNTSMIMSAAPSGKLGIAGSTNGFMRNFGSAVGVSFFSSILYALMGRSAGHRVDGYIAGQPDVFLSAMHTVYRLAAALLAVGVLLTGWRLWQSRKKPGSSIQSSASRRQSP